MDIKNEKLLPYLEQLLEACFIMFNNLITFILFLTISLLVELLLDNKYTPKVLEEVDFSYNGKTPNINELSAIAQKIKLDKKIKNISTSQPTLKV